MSKWPLLLIMLISSFSYADEEVSKLGECSDAGILDSSMFTDVPWEAIYPIRLAGMTISPNGSGAPSEATNKVFCACDDDLGIAVPGFTNGMYEPSRLIELVRKPDCMMSLGGADMSTTSGRAWGNSGKNETLEGDQAAFWNYHYYAYPLLLMLEMTVANRCGDGYLSMDLLYLSELDPTWNDAELAYFANPESVIFSNPISIAACIADNVAAATGKPIDSLFWCAGAWGGIYPITGYVTNKSSNPSKTSLLATRSLASLHRRLLARKTMGDDALCDAPIFPTIPKSQYKMNMMYPVPERGGSVIIQSENEEGEIEEEVIKKGYGHEIGEPAMLWGEWRNIPSKEDYIYMLWKYNDCCSTLY